MTVEAKYSEGSGKRRYAGIEKIEHNDKAVLLYRKNGEKLYVYAVLNLNSFDYVEEE